VAAVHRVLRDGGVVRIEIEFGIGRSHNFDVTAARIEADAARGAVLVLYDVSEIRRLERVRRDFVANVSHELRTPLTAVQGFAETLLSGALDDPKTSRRFLEIIREHAARLGRLTDDLLKLSAIEAGKLMLQMRPVKVENLFEVCLETARQVAAGKNIEVGSEDSAAVPPLSCRICSTTLCSTLPPAGASRCAPGRTPATWSCVSRTLELAFLMPSRSASSNDSTAWTLLAREKQVGPAWDSPSPVTSSRPTEGVFGWRAKWAKARDSSSRFRRGRIEI
jgi:hypothetical protein